MDSYSNDRDKIKMLIDLGYNLEGYPVYKHGNIFYIEKISRISGCGYACISITFRDPSSSSRDTAVVFVDKNCYSRDNHETICLHKISLL